MVGRIEQPEQADFGTRRDSIEGLPTPSEAVSQKCIDEFLVTELLVTRLRQNPEAARYHVHHSRRVAEGLYIEDLENEKAEVNIPPYEAKSNLPPCLLHTHFPSENFWGEK